MRLALAVSGIVLCGCGGFLTWRTVYRAASPDGRAELEVQEKACFADCAVQVVLRMGWHQVQVATRSDCAVTFAHAAWHGSKVAVFVDAMYCGAIRAAFDTSAGRSLEFDEVKQWLGKSIVEAYGVSAEELRQNGGDVYTWAHYPGDGKRRRSMDEFQKRYPRQ